MRLANRTRLEEERASIKIFLFYKSTTHLVILSNYPVLVLASWKPRSWRAFNQKKKEKQTYEHISNLKSCVRVCSLTRRPCSCRRCDSTGILLVSKRRTRLGREASEPHRPGIVANGSSLLGLLAQRREVIDTAGLGLVAAGHLAHSLDTVTEIIKLGDELRC